MKKKNYLALALAVALSTGLPSFAQAQSAADFQDAEYDKSGGLELINAAEAYAQGYTGKGITLGICDSPINFANPEFNKKLQSYMATVLSVNDGPAGVYDWTDSNLEHGTHVAGIAAAGRNGIGMQGVAYDAEIMGTVNAQTVNTEGENVESMTLYDVYLSRPEVKIINNSWGDEKYLDSVVAGGMTPAKYEEHKAAFLNYFLYSQRLRAIAQDKLMVLAASNCGTTTSAEGSAIGLFSAGAGNNTINVTNIDNYTSRVNGEIIASNNLMDNGSSLAKYVEDTTVAARGDNILSANSAYASQGTLDISLGGTSMAAPFVTGSAALVQQAFPYMSAKQLGDVLLSTANDNITVQSGLVVTLQQTTGGSPVNQANIFVVDPALNGLSEDEIVNRCLSSNQGNSAWDLERLYPYGEVHVYYDTALQELVGQGVVDAGAAVRGPGALNARRLSSSDISGSYTVGGTNEQQALYTVDTKGYDSVWSNNIKEIKAGYIAADSTEEDLRARYAYYHTNWLSYSGVDAAYRAGAAVTTKTLMDVYNRQAADSGLVGLHVGLYKAGAGTLALTGTNTYAGSSIAAGGTLAINGSVAGDAWSITDSAAGTTGTISGSGTIGGSLYNHGIVRPAADGDLKVSGNFTSDGTIALVTSDAGQSARGIIAYGAANINGSTLQAVSGGSYLPDRSYTFLSAAGGITGSLTNTEGSAFSGLLSVGNVAVSGTSGAVTLALANHMGSLSGNQQWVYDSLADLVKNTQSDTVKQAQLGALLGASAETGRAALASAAQSGSADAGAVTMSSLSVMNAIGARSMYLSTAPLVQGGLSPARSEDDVTTRSALIPVDLGTTGSGWIKFSKSWESLGSNATKGHGFAASFGFDRSIGADWRLGEFFTYGDNSFTSVSSSLKNKDYRLGIYGIREKGAEQTFLYFDLGQQQNDSTRYIQAGGSYMADSSYKSHTIELGGRYAQDIDYGKAQSWHRKPYGEVQIVRYRQDGYTESGAGVWNQQAGSAGSTYGAVTIGMGVEKKMQNDELELHLGYKRVLAGSDPTYPVHWVDGADNGHTVRGSGLDKNLLVLGLHAEQNQEDGWRLAGDVELEQGHSQRNIQASVTLKKSW